MKIKKIFFKLFTLFASFMFVALLSCQNIHAAFYESDLNKVANYKVDRQADSLSLDIQYQNGVRDIKAYICDSQYLPGSRNDTNFSRCVSNPITRFDFNDPEIVNESEQLKIYRTNISSPSQGKHLNTYDDKFDANGNPNNQYTIIIQATFCMVRNENNNEYTCKVWANNSTQIYYLMEHFTINGGLTGSGELNQTLSTVLGIINRIVIPVLWVILGVVLIVRGILLGMAIVKSADEPEVRKKKVNGLIWLFIGVGVGYVVSIAASFVMDMFGYGGIFS